MKAAQLEASQGAENTWGYFFHFSKSKWHGKTKKVLSFFGSLIFLWKSYCGNRKGTQGKKCKILMIFLQMKLFEIFALDFILIPSMYRILCLSVNVENKDFSWCHWNRTGHPIDFDSGQSWSHPEEWLIHSI